MWKTTTLTGKPSWARLSKSPISMVNPPSPHSEKLAARERGLGSDCLGHGIGHRPMPERADQPPLTVHRKITSGPHGGQSDIAGEDRILSRQIADRLGDLLRMDELRPGVPLARSSRPLRVFALCTMAC